MDESLKPPTASNNSLVAELNYINNAIQVKFDGSCLKQDKIIFTHKQVVNIYLVYKRSTVGQDFTLGNSLFGDVKLSKNTAAFDKYKYSGNGIGFDACKSFSLSYGSGGGSSEHVDNRNKDIQRKG